MNRPIGRIAIACLVLFGALLINSNILQVGKASSLRANPHNVRVLYGEYDHQRGPIVVAGKDVAKSLPTKGSLKYLRTYPGGALYAPVTGYYSLTIGTSGIEQSEDPLLAGTDDRLFVRRIADEILGRTPRGGSVVLTLNPKAQQAAYDGLHGRRGAVVALDPSTGAILAMVSSPSYDPSQLSGHDGKTINRSYQQLLNNPDQPLLNRALSATYPPGSLFKIVTASAAFAGKYTPDSRVPSPTALKLPLTTTMLHNFGGETCGDGKTDTISDAFRISCNTAFAGLGLSVGIKQLAAQAKAFGIGSTVNVPMTATPSRFDDTANPPNTALSAIGQYNDALTPLQAASIGATIGNHGVRMRPYLVQELRGPDSSVISPGKPRSLGRAVSDSVATEVTGIMQLVVDSGTGTAAQISGVKVAGKTGTAQHGTADQHLAPHAWFVGFAPAAAPRVAVAVIVEDGGGLGSDATGGAVAAPIARSVMCAVIGCS